MNAQMANKISKTMESIIHVRLDEDRLLVPALPEVATACMALLKEPEFSAKAVITKLERDPLLAAQVIRAANAAAYGQGGKTLSAAVTRLGAAKLRAVIVQAAARPLFESNDNRIVKVTAGLWRHSVAVAILARDLAALSGEAAVEEIYLAGLLHDVGKVVTAGMLLEAERGLNSQQSGVWVSHTDFVAIVQRLHRAVGVALAEKWALGPEVTESIRDSSEYRANDRRSAANYVCFANALAKLEGFCVGEIDKEDVEAIVMIGRSLLGVDDQVTARLKGDLGDRVRLGS